MEGWLQVRRSVDFFLKICNFFLYPEDTARYICIYVHIVVVIT